MEDRRKRLFTWGVFFGLGQMVFGLAIVLAARIMPRWLGSLAVSLGIAAMALTMALPDDLHLYTPIFYLNSVWFVMCGLQLLRWKQPYA